MIIAFHPSGFEIHFEVELGGVANMVRRLEQGRYRPSRELAYTAEGLPICPRHDMPMQKRQKQGDVWFSHKVTDPNSGEVIYCRGYASPSSPGFDVLPAATAAVAETEPANGQNGKAKPGTTNRQNVDSNGNGRSPNRQPVNKVNLDKLNKELFG
jgi:hypothetical protein